MKRWPRRSMTITLGDQDMFPSHLVTKTCFHHTWWMKWFPTCLSSLIITPAGRPRYFIHCFRWPVHSVCHTRWPRQDTCQLHHRTRWSRQPTCLSHKVIKTWYLSIAPGDQDILPVHHTKWPGHHTCLSHQVIKTSYLSHQWPRRSMTVNHIRWPRHLTCLGGQDFLPVYHTKCSRSFTYMSHQVK